MSSTDDRHGDEQTDTRLAAEYAKNHPKPDTAALASDESSASDGGRS